MFGVYNCNFTQKQKAETEKLILNRVGKIKLFIMGKFNKFEINNQKLIIGGTVEKLQPTTTKDNTRDLFDTDKKRFILFV